MKKVLYFALALIVVVGLLVSCGTPAANNTAAATTTAAAAESTTAAEATTASNDSGGAGGAGGADTADDSGAATEAAAAASTSAAAATTTAAAAAADGNGGGAIIFGEDPLEVDWYINYDWATDGVWADPKLGEKWILENKFVTINYLGSGGAAQQRFATMLVDNSYPAIISIDRGQDLERLVAANALVPLDEWIEGSNLQRLIGDGVIDMLRASDGRLYSYPNWAIGPGRNNGNAGWFLNMGIYQELGSPKLETFDELYDYLVTVRDTYPDIIPLEAFDAGNPFGLGGVVFCGMAENLLKNYWAYYAIPKDGALSSIYYDEYFKETLLFINKLYREKLLTQDLFTQNSDQATEKVLSGRTAVMCYGDAASLAGKNRPDFLAANPGNDLMFIDPIHKQGLDLQNIYTESSNRLGWNIAVISKDSPDPAATFELLDWLFGEEGSRISVLGPPDLYYVEGDYNADGFPNQIKDAYYSLTPDELANIGFDNWVGNTSFVDGLGEYLMDLPGGTKDWTKIQQINIIWPRSIDATEFSYFEPDPSTSLGMIYQEMKSLHAEAMATIVMSDSEQACLENIEKYAQIADDGGLGELLAFQTEIYKTNLASLGKPFPVNP